MKKRVLTIFLVFGSLALFAQSKIGTNPGTLQSGQLLELEKQGNRAGLKIAEVALTGNNDVTTVKLPSDQTKAKGTLIWNTATVGGPNAVNPGFYVWTGSIWEVVNTGATAPTANLYSADGTLSGNRTVNQAGNTLSFTSSATSGTSHFTVDGTTVNVDAANHKVGIGTATPAEKLDVTGNVRLSGALMPGGSAGTSGQILTSAGSGTAPIWTSASSLPVTVSNASNTNTLTTTVNGVTATGVSIINSNALTSSGGNLVSTVNGVSSAVSLSGLLNGSTTVSNASNTNTLTTTVNGVTGTGVNIINSNALSTSGSNLVSTVNGVSSSVSLSGLLNNATTVSNTVTSPNSLTTTVNGVTGSSVSMVTGVSNNSNTNTLTTTVNGVAGTGVSIINSNSLAATNGSLVSTVNGVTSSGVNVLTSANSGLTASNGAVSLGGTLGAATTITTDATKTLAISGLQLGSSSDQVVVADATTGVLKKVSGASLPVSVSNASNTNTLTTTVNGVTGTGVNIINSNALSTSGNNLVSTVNGVSSSLSIPTLLSGNTTVSNTVTSPNSLTTTVNGVTGSSVSMVTGVSNNSSTNTLTTTVNGVAGTGVNIINSNALSTSGSNLVSTVNGVSSSVSLSGLLNNATTVSNTVTSPNSLTTTVNGVTGSSVSMVTGVSNSSSTNTLTTTVNGVTGTGVNIINSNALASASNAITSTVNGVTATLTPAAGGTIAESLGFNAAGALVRQTANAANTPNIYSSDGTIAAARTVTLGANNLSFSSSTGNLIFNPSGTGRVGIANTSPAERLDVTGNVRFSGALMPGGAAGTSGQVLTSAGAGAAPTWTSTSSLPVTVSNASSTNTLTTTVNGVTGTGVNIINSNALSTSGNNLVSTVNGVSSSLSIPTLLSGNTTVSNTVTSPNSLTTTVNGVTGSSVSMVTGVSNSSSTNTLTTTVNGVAGTGVNIINSNALSTSGSNLVSTVNGVSSSVNVSGLLSSATTVSNASNTNTLTTTVNGVTGTGVSIINSNALTASGNNLVSTVNGVSSSVNTPDIYSTDGTIAASTNRQITLGDRATSKLSIAPAGEFANVATLNVVGGAANGGITAGILVSSNYTDNTSKMASLKTPQYVNANPPVQSLFLQNDQTKSALWIGGNNSSTHANPTEINFRVDGDADMTNSSSTSSVNAMTILGTSGNVGIGTATPTEKLQVAGNVLFSGALMPSGSAGTSGQILTSAGAGAAPIWTSTSSLPVTVSNNSSTNTLTTTVNGVTGTGVNIINSNVLASASNAITSTVNGVTATLTPTAGGTITENLGFNASGALVRQTNSAANTPNIYTANGSLTGNRVVSTGTSLLTFRGTNAQPATTGTTTNAAVRIDGGTNHALDIGTFTNSPYGAYLQVASTTDLSIGLPLIFQPVAGNVGIAKINPSEKLDVAGNVRFSGALMPNNAAGTSGQVLTSAGSGAAPTWTSTSSLPVTVSNTSSTNTLTTTVNGVTGTGVNIINSNVLASASNAITSTVNGVTATLTPAAGGTITENLGFNSSGALVRQTNSAANTPNIYTADGTIAASTNRQITLGDRATSKLSIAPAGEFANVATLNVVGGTATGGINAGILVSSNYTDNTNKIGAIKTPQYVNANPPVQELVAVNDQTSNALWIGGISSSSQANPTSINFRVDGDADLTNAASVAGVTAMSILGTSGNVGVGTISPENRLHVVSPTAANSRYALIDAPNGTAENTILGLRNTSATATGNNAFLGFVNNGATAGGASWAIGSRRDASSEYFTIANSTGGSYFYRVNILSNGNFGINTATPTERLDVTGNVRFSGALMPNNTAGTSGQFLTSGGAGVAPTWTTPSASNTPNIYSANGTLSGNRTVTMAANDLTLNATDGNLIYSPSGTGKVGIGITSPTALLHINGATTSEGALTVNSGGALITGNGTPTVTIKNPSNNARLLFDDVTASQKFSIGTGGAAGDFEIYNITKSNSNVLSIDAATNDITIGNSSLIVNGSISAQGYANQSSSSAAYTIKNDDAVVNMGTGTITLPTSPRRGHLLWLRNTTGANRTVSGGTWQNLSGTPTNVVTNNTSILIYYSGAAWLQFN